MTVVYKLTHMEFFRNIISIFFFDALRQLPKLQIQRKVMNLFVVFGSEIFVACLAFPKNRY